MNQFWENEFIQLAGYYSVVVVCIILALALFELVTKYRNWEEIKKEIWLLQWQLAEKYLDWQTFSATLLPITIRC